MLRLYLFCPRLHEFEYDEPKCRWHTQAPGFSHLRFGRVLVARAWSQTKLVLNATWLSCIRVDRSRRLTRALKVGGTSLVHTSSELQLEFKPWLPPSGGLEPVQVRDKLDRMRTDAQAPTRTLLDGWAIWCLSSAP